MHACMYAYMHVCLHMCMYACMCVCLHASMHVWIDVCMNVCMHECLNVCMYVCMHERMHVCTVCIYAHMYECIHVCMHVCLYVYMYTCMYVCMHVCLHVCIYVPQTNIDVCMLCMQIQNIGVGQLEKTWAVNHVVGRSKHSCIKLTKSFQQVFNLKFTEFFSELRGSMSHNHYCECVEHPRSPFPHWASVKAAWCCQPSCVAQCIPLDYNDSSRSTENQVTCTLPFLPNPSSITKMLS